MENGGDVCLMDTRRRCTPVEGGLDGGAIL